MKKLLLGSTSRSRQLLLEEAQIPFEVIGHDADEESVPRTSISETVQNIARLKMEHVKIPDGQEGDVVFVLTADSMGCGVDGTIHGKPKNREDAIKKLQALRGESSTFTGFCIERKRYQNGAWHTEQKREGISSARCKFVVPDAWVDRYLEHSWGLSAAGAIAIELYGAQFLEWIDGSFSAVMGLPLFEVRQALEEMGFFDALLARR